MESAVGVGILSLALAFDGNDGLYASARTLAKAFRVDERSVKRQITKLVGAGHAVIEHKGGRRIVRVSDTVRNLLRGDQSVTPI